MNLIQISCGQSSTDAVICESRFCLFTWSHLIDIIRSTSVDLGCLASCGVVRGRQVVAGGYQREVILLCILCISTPPHRLTQLPSFIFACGAVLPARSQLSGITPQHPASSHTGREWFTSAAYPHTHMRAEFTTTARALTERFLSSSLSPYEFAWFWWACSCSGAEKWWCPM